MASNRNDVARQKRASQNRAQREALSARTKAAATPREERVAAAVAASGSGERGAGGNRAGNDRKNSDAKGASTSSARESMAQGRLGETPVDIDTLEGSFLSKLVRVPGGLQVVMAAVLGLVMAVMVSVTKTVPPEGAKAGAKATRTLFEAYGPTALLFLGPPLVLVGNAVVFGLHAKRRRMWTMSAVMLGIFSLFMPQFLFPAGMLGYGVLRAKRIEDGLSRRRRPGRRGKDRDGTESAGAIEAQAS